MHFTPKILLQVLNGLIVKIKWNFAVQLKLFNHAHISLLMLSQFFLSFFFYFATSSIAHHSQHNTTTRSKHLWIEWLLLSALFSLFSYLAWGMKKRHKGISDLYFFISHAWIRQEFYIWTCRILFTQEVINATITAYFWILQSLPVLLVSLALS